MSINANNAALNEILEAINELPEAGSGKEEIETTIDITKNGTTEITPDDENTTLSKVTVNVDVPIKDEQSKTIDITENGTITIAPDEGVVWNEVTVNTAIESGGGEDTLSQLWNKTLVRCSNDNVQELGNYFFANNPYLVSVDLPNVYRPYDYTFENCTNLTSVNLPKAIYVGPRSHSNNTSLTGVSYPSAATIYTGAFMNATMLKWVDIGVTTNFVRTQAFLGCNSFDTLILRGNEVSTLSNINNFNGGAFNVGGEGGTIYVPSALIEAYKTATNWSVLYEAGRCNFVAIEGSEYE